MEIENEQRQRQRHRYGHQHHARFPPAQRQPHQQRHRKRRQQQVLQQIVRFLLCRLPVIPRHRHFQVVGNRHAAQRIHLVDHRLRDHRGVRPLPLRHRQRHRRVFPADCLLLRAAVAEENVIAVLARPVHHIGHVAQIHRLPVEDAHHHVPRVVRVADEPARLHHEFPVRLRERSRDAPLVRQLERPRDRARAQVIGGQALRIQRDAQLALRPADDRRFRNVVHLLHRDVRFLDDLPQLIAAVPVAPERQRQNRHVVDRAHLDQRPRSARRHAVEIRIQLVVGAHHRVVLRYAHVVPHRHQRLARHARRIDVFDPGNLLQQLLHRDRHALLDFLGRRPAHRNENVEHRHHDLRVLFPRRLQHRESAQQQRCDDDQRRQPRIDERMRNFSRQSAFQRPASAFLPSRSRAPGFVTTRSPGPSPESTTRPVPVFAPSVTSRRWMIPAASTT